jgi:NAD(P)-dependent dehydrogenase (short-subunit alcohol dehydrogenase family)
MSKVVLVTGASMGIGRSIARHLSAAGYRVFGTSRRPASPTLDGFEMLALDVTSDESAQACIAEVIARAGRLDVLINNAGVDLLGALEETTMPETEWVFATNYFGAVRMVNAALPHMRRQRAGQIINISSGLGLAAVPFEGQYCAAKFALEGYTESLRYELWSLGIKVSSVQPGYYQSNMVKTQRIASNLIEDYTPARDRYIAFGTRAAEDAPDPLPVAQTVRRIIESRSPRPRYQVGWDAWLAPRLARLMPEALVMRVGGWMYGITDWRRDAANGGLVAGIALLGVLLGWRWRKRH